MKTIEEVKKKMKEKGYSFWDEEGNFKYKYNHHINNFLIIGHRGHCIATEEQLNEAIKNHISA